MERFELVSMQHLAARAATLLEEPRRARTDAITLQNMHRLLEMYRFDAFVEETITGVVEHRALKDALDAASAFAFPGVSKARVAELLEDLVAQLARGLEPDQGAVLHGRRFFEELVRACTSQHHSVVPNCT